MYWSVPNTNTKYKVAAAEYFSRNRYTFLCIWEVSVPSPSGTASLCERICSPVQYVYSDSIINTQCNENGHKIQTHSDQWKTHRYKPSKIETSTFSSSVVLLFHSNKNIFCIYKMYCSLKTLTTLFYWELVDMQNLKVSVLRRSCELYCSAQTSLFAHWCSWYRCGYGGCFNAAACWWYRFKSLDVISI